MNSLSHFRFCVILAVLEIAYTAIAIARSPRPDFYLIGDCPYYAATVESLIQDGDWNLRNQLEGDLPDHHGFFALSRDNRVVPKHSVLLPILSIPFFLVFGKIGLLVVNLVQLFALLYGIMLLAGNDPPARLLTLAGYLSTPFLAYTSNYSPDLLGTTLFVWSYVFAVRNRPILCGLCAGLAIWAKIYLALLLLPLALIVIPQGWKATAACGVAALISLAPMLIIQNHLFGSPFITGYDRDARLTPDGFIVTEHYSRFHQPLLTGLGNLLFDATIGMLKTAPLWFLWPAGVVIGYRRSEKKDHQAAISLDFPLPDTRYPIPLLSISLIISLMLNLLFFARYDEWNASMFGNRFLFPALAAGLLLQAPLWRWALARSSSANNLVESGD